MERNHEKSIDMESQNITSTFDDKQNLTKIQQHINIYSYHTIFDGIFGPSVEF